MRLTLIWAAIALALSTGCTRSGGSGDADLVLTNAYVYTADDAHSVAEAVAIAGDSVVFVGTNAAVADYVGDATVVRAQRCRARECACRAGLA